MLLVAGVQLPGQAFMKLTSENSLVGLNGVAYRDVQYADDNDALDVIGVKVGDHLGRSYPLQWLVIRGRLALSTAIENLSYEYVAHENDVHF